MLHGLLALITVADPAQKFLRPSEAYEAECIIRPTSMGDFIFGFNLPGKQQYIYIGLFVRQ